MAVSLTISETLDGAQVSDSLAGGGTGVDLGSCSNNSFAPLVNKTLNQGRQNLYIRHDAVVDPITDVKTFIQQYGVGTGFTYGGADSAANDYSLLVSLGQASGSSKNNNDGLSGGLWIDMDWDSNDTTRFDHANFPTLVKIYGDSGTDGISLASAFQIRNEAMVYDNGGGEAAPSAPVNGTIGRQGAPTVLGDNAHINLRFYLPNAHTQGGIAQWEVVSAFSYTAGFIAAMLPGLMKLVESFVSHQVIM
jgi:hypothetical protein